MADSLPPVLLEACVVVGASEDKLGEICQVSPPLPPADSHWLTLAHWE